MVNLDRNIVTDLLRQSMREGKAPFLRVVSNSMAPLIVSGDQVRVTEISPASLQAGDVIVLEENQELLTHRYWGQINTKELQHIITKGDRPQHFDLPHPSDNLVGLVTGRKRDSRLLDFSAGAGRWFIRQLVCLSKVDARLFATSPVTGNVGSGEWFERDGSFASSTRDYLGHRLSRRIIYILAKMIILAVRPFEQPIQGS